MKDVKVWRCQCGLLVAFVLTMVPMDDGLAADPFDRSGAFARGDFDNDGLIDLVASSPETNCGKGAVYVLSGTGGVTEWTRDTSGILGTAACDDHFGASLSVGDFNGDGYDDLATGAPGASDPGPTASGVVHVIYGSSTGLTDEGDQMWHQDVAGIQGDAEAYDYFGDSLAAGDFNCDGNDDLAIGVPREDIGTTTDAGAVHVLYGRGTGLSSLNDMWYQGAGGVDGTAEEDDHFGAALAAGNFNGDSEEGIGCSDLAIGAPNEDVGSSIVDAGYLYIIFGDYTNGLSTTGDQGFDQDTSGVEDSCENNDQFAFRLESRDLDNDGYDEVVSRPQTTWWIVTGLDATLKTAHTSAPEDFAWCRARAVPRHFMACSVMT